MMRLDLRNMLFCFFLLLGHGISITRAAQITYTIDDTWGDEVTHVVPTYLPTAATNPIGNSSPWAGPECGGCAIQPDPKQARNGTWHAATYHPEIDSISIEFPFTGNAISVYFIIPHTIPFVTTDVACNFSVDGQRVSTFFRNPTDPNAIIYNFLAFQQTGLTNAPHTLKIETGNGYSHDAFVAFDYAQYTYDDSNGPIPTTVPATSSASPTTMTGSSPTGGGATIPTTPVPTQSSDGGGGTKHTNVAAIAGGVVGGVGIIVLLALIFLLLSRRKRASNSPEAAMAPSALYYTGHGPPPDTATTGAMPFQQYGEHKSSRHTMGSPPITAGPNTALAPNRYVPPAPSSTAGGSQSGLGSATLTASDEKASLRTQQTADELKRARQRELQRQLQAVKAEMRALQADLQESQGGLGGAEAERTTSVRSQRGRDRGNDQEVFSLREQIRVMSEQMEMLRLQQDSAWAQGLSDEPPPGYSPHPSQQPQPQGP